MIELLFDDEFGLSDGEISEEESENAYCLSISLFDSKKS